MLVIIYASRIALSVLQSVPAVLVGLCWGGAYTEQLDATHVFLLKF